MENIKQRIYEAMDSFLTEAKDQDGRDRSIERLNQDRHLFVKRMVEIIEQAVDEMMVEERGTDPKACKGNPIDSVANQGFNQCCALQKEKRDKIKNKLWKT